MIKWTFLAFGVLTLLAVYLTVYGVGVQDGSIERSVRQGSASHLHGGRVK